jgi:hypothetical protein
MRKTILAAVFVIGVYLSCFADKNDYGTVCSNVITALTNKRILVSPGFTNQLYTYIQSKDIQVSTLASLTLSISFFDLFETSLRSEYDEGCRYCTNVLYSVALPQRSWQESVASLLYAAALHRDGRREDALEICRTALSVHLDAPTTGVECAVWSAMSRGETNVPEMSITNSLKMAAALSVPIEKRSSEWGVYTNGLPAQAINILLE